VACFGYDPYNAKSFITRWEMENGPFGLEVVRQGVKTESVPLGEIKKLAEDRDLLFDEAIMSFTMGNAIVLVDNNRQKKLMKRRYDQKIDNVSALMDAFVAYKLHKDSFE
jgi:phage terminase large subunit-like protein